MVEHLALGRSSRGQLLITRALPDAVQAGVYFFRNCLRDGAPAEEFAGALAGFARQIISSGLFHPDFHCGNVLYLPERHKFALVDVYGVRKAFLFDRFQLFRMERILMELRQALDRGTMLRSSTNGPDGDGRYWRVIRNLPAQKARCCAWSIPPVRPPTRHPANRCREMPKHLNGSCSPTSFFNWRAFRTARRSCWTGNGICCSGRDDRPVPPRRFPLATGRSAWRHTD